MAFSSYMVTQASTSNVSQGSVNQEVLRVEIIATEVLAPIDLTSLEFKLAPLSDIADFIGSIRFFCYGISLKYNL